MAKREKKLNITHRSGFLWPEERKLMYWMIAEQNHAFTWEDPERRRFKEEYFPVIKIPIVAHVVMETLDSTELLMEDQAWLDYLWDFETKGINLDLSSDTD